MIHFLYVHVIFILISSIYNINNIIYIICTVYTNVTSERNKKKQYEPVLELFIYVAFNLNFGIFKSVGWFIYRGKALNLYDLKTVVEGGGLTDVLQNSSECVDQDLERGLTCTLGYIQTERYNISYLQYCSVLVLVLE